jgi:hypothetical protein
MRKLNKAAAVGSLFHISSAGPKPPRLFSCGSYAPLVHRPAATNCRQSANLMGRLSTRRRRRCAEPSLVAALPPTGLNQSWQKCECMRYSADATVPDNARGNRKAAAGVRSATAPTHLLSRGVGVTAIGADLDRDRLRFWCLVLSPQPPGMCC